MESGPIVVLALAALAGCSHSPADLPAAVPPLHAAQTGRDPALAPVRAALEDGRAEEALDALRPLQGFEAACLRARAHFLRGDGVAALSEIERARELDPLHPELASTEVEVLAGLGKVPAASELLAAALKRSGMVPELLRAQGVVELQRQGRARAGLEALERARSLDPGLPFLRWPLGQAHLLVGRERLEKAPAEATAHARAALAFVPELTDALELEAEGLTGELRFDEALARYEELEALGSDTRETRATLHQRAATRALLEHDRAKAVDHTLAARALGLDDEALGFGAELLRQEHGAALERGIAAADGNDWEVAEREFARALELLPGDIEAENHLAVARFQRGEYRAAAEAWQVVLERSRARGIALPDPVPLNLAKAWRLAGEHGRARAAVSDLLDREPDGPWSAPARELLLVLEAEELPH